MSSYAENLPFERPLLSGLVQLGLIPKGDDVRRLPVPFLSLVPFRRINP